MFLEVNNNAIKDSGIKYIVSNKIDVGFEINLTITNSLLISVTMSHHFRWFCKFFFVVVCNF